MTNNIYKVGDKLIVEHYILKGEREVEIVEDNCILVKNHIFNWYYFFEVNHILRKV